MPSTVNMLGASAATVNTINVQRITSTGTYTPTTGTLFAIVEVQGGGASGFGGTGVSAWGSGGGGGGYAKSIIPAANLFPTVSVTIGSGGTGTTGAGANGGNTSFPATGGFSMTGNGGATGSGSAGTTRTPTGGGRGGSASGGNIYNLNGGNGSWSVGFTNSNSLGGAGGGGLYGRGGGAAVVGATAANAATANTGGGGSGIAGLSGNGGNGGSGVVIITEFISSKIASNRQTMIDGIDYSSPINALETRVFTSSGTYTPTSGMRFCIVDVHGGGGAGGTANTSVSTYIAAGGGGSGAFSRGLYSAATIGASRAVTIGTGNNSFGSLISCGTGAVGNNGELRGNQSIGMGGNGGAIVTGGNVFALSGIQGGIGSQDTGTFNTSLEGVGGRGADGYMGQGAAPSVWGVNTYTAAAANSGAGGVGGSITSGTRAGSAGSSGIVTILEFLSV